MSAPPDAAPDELTGARAVHRRRWVAPVLAVAVLVAVLSVRAGGGGPDVPATQGSARPAPSPVVTEAVVRPSQRVEFVDPDTALGIRISCDGARCENRVALSRDGARTFDPVGALPDEAVSWPLLVSGPGPRWAVLDAGLTQMARTLDGGRSWQVVRLAPGRPGPVPDGVELQVPCRVRCEGLAWVDVAAGTVHPLPSTPAVGVLGVTSRPTGASPLIVTTPAGQVLLSRDGGDVWRTADFPLDGREVAQRPVVLPTGEFRIYAFLEVYDAAGQVVRVGFRSDDAGFTWTGVGYPSRAVDGRPTLNPPRVSIGGELLTTDSIGRLLLSSGGGTAFEVVPEAPRDALLTQDRPGQPVVATAPGPGGYEIDWISGDGRTWQPFDLGP